MFSYISYITKLFGPMILFFEMDRKYIWFELFGCFWSDLKNNFNKYDAATKMKLRLAKRDQQLVRPLAYVHTT